jgi:hypothetical protein
MLESVLSVRWNDLEHADGTATDIPRLLSVIGFGSQLERDHAISELWSNINHQGTTYQAAAPTLPFVGELARSDRVPVRDRARLICMIGSVGGGTLGLDVGLSLVGYQGPNDAEDEVITRDLIQYKRAARAAAARELTRLLRANEPIPDELLAPIANLAAQVDKMARRHTGALREMRLRVTSSTGRLLFDVALELVEHGTVSDLLVSKAERTDAGVYERRAERFDFSDPRYMGRLIAEELTDRLLE